MRLRTLFFSLLALPVFAQVWLPDGSQIRLWQKAPASLRQNNRDMYRGLERVDPAGRHSHLPYPEFLKVQGTPTYGNGCAYITGHRHHPARDRLSGWSGSFPTEVWISRDFKTWQPFATWGPDAETRRTASRPWSYGNSLTALHPLGNGKFLGTLTSELAIFHRDPDGTLVWERNLDPAVKGLLRRTSKGFVLLADERYPSDFWFLDATDASVLQHATLKTPLKDPRPVLALARPDGRLLVVLTSDSAGRYLGVDYSNSTLAAACLVRAFARQQTPAPVCEWLLLDPGTGLQAPLTPPAGLRVNTPWELMRLQFRDAQNLEW